MMYNHKEIEKKWKALWEEKKVFETNIGDFSKPKYYILDMFPYTSGAGLHVGHAEGYTATDIISRMKRMQGFNVLHPMGFDSFGLPSEQYAINTGNNPEEFTLKNIDRFIEQLKNLGYDFDWSKKIITCDKDYYKWTQWIFKQMYLDGLAEYVDMPVNWCEELGTVLANDEVIDGKSERGGFPVVKKNMKQWVIKIPEYADQLLEGLKHIHWPDSTKEMQKNWIGKSEGTSINFNIENSDLILEIFTTRVDTLYGATYCVISPDHPLIDKLVKSVNKDEVNKYVNAVEKKSELGSEKISKDKSGVFTGSYAINPINHKKIPIWISDYVLSTYGTGAVMGVPAHDKRDFEFANKYNLEIVKVIDENGLLINSYSLNGLKSEKAAKIILDWLETKNIGKRKVNYKLRNWIFARQRYWGEPVPLIHMEDGSIKVLEDIELPLELPLMNDYRSRNGQAPLENAVEWKRVEINGVKGKRETCTMPGSAASSWYFLRYIDPKNNNIFADYDLLKHWMPVDLYLGGSEHTVGHLLYSRMWNRYLYNKGLVPTAEPFDKLVHPGMILGADNEKMSKSKGNVVNPDEIIENYGADALRLYLMFMGPINCTKAWNDAGVKGARKFLDKVWNLFVETDKVKECDNKNLEFIYHETVMNVTKDLEQMNFNTAISKLMIFLKILGKEENIPMEYAIGFIKLLNPIAPFVTEEIHSILLKKNVFLALESWPTYDINKIEKDMVNVVFNINNKKKLVLSCPKNLTQEELIDYLMCDEKARAILSGLEIENVFFVQNRMINFITRTDMVRKRTQN